VNRESPAATSLGGLKGYVSRSDQTHPGESGAVLLDLRPVSTDRPQGHSFVGHEFLIWGLLVIRGFLNNQPGNDEQCFLIIYPSGSLCSRKHPGIRCTRRL